MRIVLALDDNERAAAFAVRHEVFVLEQGVPAELELDDLDAAADHFLLYDDAAPVGTVRLVVEPPGFAGADPGLGDVAHLGRLAVRKPARRAGAGARLVEAVEARAHVRELRTIALAAQTPAIPFYERLGYVAEGAEFDDAGLPHRWMHKRL